MSLIFAHGSILTTSCTLNYIYLTNVQFTFKASPRFPNVRKPQRTWFARSEMICVNADLFGGGDGLVYMDPTLKPTKIYVPHNLLP